MVEERADLDGRPRLELVRLDGRQPHAARRVRGDDVVAKRSGERALHDGDDTTHCRRASPSSVEPVDEASHVGPLDLGQTQPPERAGLDVGVDVAAVVVERRALDVAALLAGVQPLVEPVSEAHAARLDELALIVQRAGLRER